MRKTRLEVADPQEWLASLAADSTALSRLVAESGGLARAAYRLARARSLVLFDAEPRLEDLQAATALISARLGRHSVLPITSLLPASTDAASSPPHLPVAPVASAEQSTRQEVQPVARSLPPPAPSSLRQSKSRPHAARASL